MIEKLTLENLSENGWMFLKDLTKTKCKVYKNWKDKNKGLLYCFYGRERKDEITKQPWKE